MKKTLQYFKNHKIKPDAKLYEEDTNAVIKYEKRCILVFEYIKKSLDKFHCNLDEYQDVQKEIVAVLVHIVKIIE